MFVIVNLCISITTDKSLLHHTVDDTYRQLNDLVTLLLKKCMNVFDFLSFLVSINQYYSKF